MTLTSGQSTVEGTVARWLMTMGLVGVVEIDERLRVADRHGTLVDWVEVGLPVAEAVPFLLGYEDLLAEIGRGELDGFRLPRFRFAGTGRAGSEPDRAPICTLRALRGPAAGCVSLLFQDASDLGALEQRVIQQRNELALAQAALTRARQRAEAANQAKSAFLANVSHELRTPLTVIIGNAELLQTRDLERMAPERRAAFIEDIYRNGHYLLDLINDLLDLSKAEAGRIDLEETVVELPGLLDEALAVARALPYCTGLELALELGDGLPALRADRLRVKQVLLNLLSNAVKHTPPGGAVVLAARAEGAAGLAIEVRDTGQGMDPAELARITEPFRQARPPVRPDAPGGTGLGLHLVHLLMARHGGTVRIDSVPGAGTTVRLEFPAERVSRGG